MVGLFRRRRPLQEWNPDLPSQPIHIGQIRFGRSHRESGLYLKTTKTRVFQTPPVDLTQRSKGVIRITFHIVPSKDGGTSSEARTAWDRIPPGTHPLLPSAISPRRYPDIQNNEVSFPLPSRDGLRPGILTVLVLPFSVWRIDPVTTTFSSTEYGLTRRPVPLSGLVRLRAVGPLQKLGQRKSGFLPVHPILPAAIPPRRYPTILNNEVFLPLHPERIHKVITRSDLGLLSPVLSGTHIPSCSLSSANNLLTVRTQNQSREIKKWEVKKFIRVGAIKIQQWRRNPSPAFYSALNRDPKSLI